MKIDKTSRIVARPFTNEEALLMVKLFNASTKEEIDKAISEHKRPVKEMEP